MFQLATQAILDVNVSFMRIFLYCFEKIPPNIIDFLGKVILLTNLFVYISGGTLGLRYTGLWYIRLTVHWACGTLDCGTLGAVHWDTLHWAVVHQVRGTLGLRYTGLWYIRLTVHWVCGTLGCGISGVRYIGLRYIRLTVHWACDTLDCGTLGAVHWAAVHRGVPISFIQIGT